MGRSIIKELWAPVAYNKRDVLRIGGNVKYWTAMDIQQELAHNRLLQPGFATRAPLEILADLQRAKHIWPWLIEYVCPRLEHAVRINLAARLSSSYQVAPKHFAEMTDRVYQTLDGDFFQQTELKIASLMAPLRAQTENDWLSFFHGQMERDGRCTFATLDRGTELLNALIRIGLDQAEYRISNQVLRGYLKAHCARLEGTLLKAKPAEPDPMNYMVLGAAGSGKSSVLAEKHLSEEMVIIISADHYRAIEFAGIDSRLTDEQVFIKTQDTAFWIKERVVDIVLNEYIMSPNRPPIIIDGMSVDPWTQEIINRSKTEVFVACLGAAREIPGRVWKRAEDPNASLGDKNRHIHTTALLQMHRDSSDVLANVPRHANITLYNTHTPDHFPKKIAALDTVHGVMVIDDLVQIGFFLGKRNLNPEARSVSELFTHTLFQRDRFQFTSRHHASSILALLHLHPRTKAKNPLLALSLKKDGQEYARIERGEHEGFRWINTDAALLLTLLNYSKERTLLLELLVQTSAYNAQRSYLGTRIVYQKVLEGIKATLEAQEMSSDQKAKIL